MLSTVRGGTDLNSEKISGQPYLTVNIDGQGSTAMA